MTAASRHHSSSRPRGRLSLGRRLERALLVFVVCVPVPALALSGLAIPLPGVVERIGAALVPWANAATLDEHSLAASTTRGRIVLVPDGSSGTDTTPALDAAEPAVTRRAPSARPRPDGPAATYTTSSSPAVPADTGDPDTSPPTPEEPAADPAPAPAPAPAPTEPSAPSDPLPTPPADTAPPTVEPVPDREPTKPDVKPVDPDVKPPRDDTDVLPPHPVPIPVPADEVPTDPDVKPDVKPDEELADLPRDRPASRGDASNAGTTL